MDNASLKSYRFGNATDIGKVRKQNEDYMGYFTNHNGDFFIVCDGMGGHAGGATASQLAVASIRNFFEQQFYHDPAEALYQAVQFANDRIYEHAQMNPSLQGMGTTAVVLLLRNARLYHAHVGDSRLYTHKFGQLQQITKDHSLVQNLVDQGLISEAEAETHPQRNQLLRALGTQPFVDVSVSDEPLLPFKGDVYLLCTDGLNGLVSNDGIEQILNQDKEVQQIALELVEMANALGGHDNITVQVIKFTEDASKIAEQYTSQEAQNLSNTHPIINYTPPPPKTPKAKSSSDYTNSSSNKSNISPLSPISSAINSNTSNNNDFVRVENRGIDLEKVQPYLWRIVLGVGLIFALFLVYQRTLGKYELLGSTGNLQQDSLRAIQLEHEVWNYILDRNPEVRQVYDTYKDTKRKLKDLRERIAQLDTAFDQLRVVENPLQKMRLTELARKYNSDVEWILIANGGKKEKDLQDLDSLIIPAMPHEKEP